jgi:hypothetical protein
VKFNRPRSSRAHSLRQKMNKNGAAWRKVDARALIASSQKRVSLSWCVSNEREHLINGACFLKVKNNKKIARARGEKFTLLNQKKCDQMNNSRGQKRFMWIFKIIWLSKHAAFFVRFNLNAA